MKTITYLLSVFCLMVFCQCKNEPKSGAKQPPFVQIPAKLTAETKPMYQAVMTMHDEAMIKVDSVVRLQKALKEVLNAEPITAPQNNNSIAIRGALSELNKAEDLMYKWMHDFNGKMDTLAPDAQKSYLVLQKAMMENVRDQILYSIEKGKKTLTH